MKKNNTALYIFMLQVVLATTGLFFGFMENSLLPFLVFLYPLVIYHIALREKYRSVLFFKISILSIITASVNLYWIAYPIIEIGGLSIVSAYCVVGLIAIALSIFPLLFSFSVYYSKKYISVRSFRLLLAGAVWILCEYMQSFLFSGFPWLSLTPALAQWIPTALPVVIFGSYAYSGLLTMFFLSIYENIRKRSLILVLFSTILFSLFATISYTLYTKEIPDGLPLNIALIQGNIEQTDKWNDNSEEHILKKYLMLTEKALHSSPILSSNFDLIIWPETALPFFLSPKSSLSQQLSSFIQNIHTPLLTGSIRYGGNAQNNKKLIFNSALLFTEQGTMRSWYDKEKLVPFGEYTPFILSKFVDILNIQRGGQFTASQSNSLLSVKNVPFGVVICYEIIFPRLVQTKVKEGANFLVTISNDAWFGYTRAAWQHLQHARLRAMENSRYLLRATNTGISAVISPKGAVLYQSSLFEDAYITATIETQTYITPYTQFAPYIMWVTLLFVFILILLRDIFSKKKNRKTLIRREI